MFATRPASVVALAAACTVLVPSLAWGHPGHAGHGGNFHDGWQHPLNGLDHLLAMIAVGLLAVRVGGRGIWLVPSAFLGSMLLGGLVGGAGWNLPGVEAGIVSSVVVLGVMVAAAGTAPIWLATSIVAAFAFLHGFAHGAEMSAGGSLATYAIGFLLTTAALLLVGIGGAAGANQIWQSSAPRAVGFTRVAGATIAACGLLMLVGLI